MGFPGGSVSKESPCNAEDMDTIPGLGRSPGEGKGYPLQYSGLENSMDSIVQFTSVAQSYPNLCNPWTVAHQASLSFINSWSLFKLMSIKSVMPSNHLIVCRPLLLCLQSSPASGSLQMNWFFESGGQSIGVFSFSISPSNEFKIDFL